MATTLPLERPEIVAVSPPSDATRCHRREIRAGLIDARARRARTRRRERARRRYNDENDELDNTPPGSVGADARATCTYLDILATRLDSTR